MYLIFLCQENVLNQKNYTDVFRGAFAKLRKATISFVISVRPSVRMERLGSHWTDFHEFGYLNIFRKSVEKIQDSLKSYQNNEHCTRRPIYIFYCIPLSYSQNEKCFRQNVADKTKTHILCYERFKIIVEPDRPQMTIGRKRIACWIPKPKNTHTEYVILIDFPLQKLLQEHASGIRYTQSACLCLVVVL